MRVAIELPQEGFLYVVDRERYRDGTSGDPYLIFPVQNLNHGDNKGEPGPADRNSQPGRPNLSFEGGA